MHQYANSVSVYTFSSDIILSIYRYNLQSLKHINFKILYVDLHATIKNKRGLFIWERKHGETSLKKHGRPCDRRLQLPKIFTSKFIYIRNSLEPIIFIMFSSDVTILLKNHQCAGALAVSKGVWGWLLHLQHPRLLWTSSYLRLDLSGQTLTSSRNDLRNDFQRECLVKTSHVFPILNIFILSR